MGKGGKRRARGARGKNSIFIGVWVPAAVAAAVNKAIQTSNMDRSTFLRLALEEKLKRERR